MSLKSHTRPARRFYCYFVSIYEWELLSESAYKKHCQWLSEQRRAEIDELCYYNGPWGLAKSKAYLRQQFKHLADDLKQARRDLANAYACSKKVSKK